MNTYSLKHRRASREQGIAVVEMALVIPVLLVTLLMIAELTRVLYQYNTLTKSVRDGSRFLSANGAGDFRQTTLSNESVIAAKNLVLSGLPQGGPSLLSGMTPGDVSVELNELGSSGVSRYYVTVSADYRYIPMIVSSDLFDFNISALSSMRAE